MRSLLARLAAPLAAAMVLLPINFHHNAALARDLVTVGSAPSGAIIIKNREHALYYTLGDGRAIRYPVAVGKQAKQWSGATIVERKVVYPIWQPPQVVRADSPNLPPLIYPGPKNPLGTRALVLANGEYAIHGTNNPGSIGHDASYGCIRMFNQDVEDLFQRVGVGTPVYVVN